MEPLASVFFTCQAKAFKPSHTDAQFLGELRLSAFLHNIDRWQGDIRKPILSIRRLAFGSEPFPVHLRGVKWDPRQDLCDPSIKIFAIEREEKQFGWVEQ